MAKRTLSLAAGVALAAGLTSFGAVAGASSASAATGCSIPASKLAISLSDLTGSSTAAAAWDWFKVSYTLDGLDGMPAGSCITFAAPKEFTGIPNSTVQLKAADGSVIGTQVMTNGVVTVTLTTDYAAKHTGVKVWGSYTAQINSSITPGSSVPLTFTVNGTVTTTKDVKTDVCVNCSAMPVGFAQKFGVADQGKGDVYVNAPTVAEAGTEVVLKDTLTSPGQAFAGKPSAYSYTARDAWGNFLNVIELPVLANADGTWSVKTQRANEAIRFSIPMTFTGAGPWTDTATVSAAGKDYSASATIKSYSVDGGGQGETPDVPVKPQAKLVDYTAQVDTYSWSKSAWYGSKIAAFDDDSTLKYREDGWMWLTTAAKKYTKYGHTFITFQAPVNATPAQLVAAYNAKAPSTLDITTTAKLANTVAASGQVTDVWVLGKGATAAQAWGAGHNVDQVFLGRR